MINIEGTAIFVIVMIIIIIEIFKYVCSTGFSTADDINRL